ncbi:MAG: phosphoribosylamine--glycine ligase [Myxococcales bacterium]|nr:phosphoribosylamine--glycine ligase [Myxococcales bacterium]MCB9702547.1 phosphoribosylamine--glycine ligase [Myxococcales bacterium]
MKILIVGGGGREHALAWRCVVEGHDVEVAPGSDGIAEDAACVAIAADDHAGLIAHARANAVDLVIVGPEQPLVDGLADRLREAGIAVLGPSAAAARLEGSKAEAKAFMARHGIPTAAYHTVASLDEGRAALQRFARPPVVKASGLAAGKGVTVAATFAEAEEALRACLEGQAFGDAGATVVLEERLEGEEASFFVLSDGARARTFVAAQDHKRLGDGDQGPNTGGMGAYCPAPVCTPAVHERVMATIVEPTLAGLRAEGTPFVGVLFVGLMIDADGIPRVIEYNVRFGDPEAQPLLFGADEPVVPHLHAAARGELTPGVIRGRAAASVVFASAGYPAGSTRGSRIRGLEALQGAPDLKVFHAGTRRGAGGWETNGGRVLGVCARGDDLRQAIARAYEGCAALSFDGMQLRHDIGARALRRR